MSVSSNTQKHTTKKGNDRMKQTVFDFIEEQLSLQGMKMQKRRGAIFSQKIIEIEKGSLPGNISFIQNSFHTIIHTSYCEGKVTKDALLSMIQVFSEQTDEPQRLFAFQFEDDDIIYIQKEKTPVYDLLQNFDVYFPGATKTENLILKREISPFLYFVLPEENNISIRTWSKMKGSFLEKNTISNKQEAIDFEKHITTIEEKFLLLPEYINKKIKEYIKNSAYKDAHNYQEISFEHISKSNVHDFWFPIQNETFNTIKNIHFRYNESLGQIFEKVHRHLQSRDLFLFCLDYMKQKGLPCIHLKKEKFQIKNKGFVFDPSLYTKEDGKLKFNLNIFHDPSLDLKRTFLTGTLEELYEQLPEVVYKKIRSCLLQSVFEENK